MSDDTDKKDEKLAEGTLISHLLELRDRFFRMGVALIIVFIPAFIYRNKLFDFLAAPVVKAGSKLITTTVVSPFVTPLKVAFYFSLFVAMPYLLSQIWGFVAPGLYRKEKRFAIPLLVSSIVLFYTGVAFAYFVVFPKVFPFFYGITPTAVENMTDINNYLDFALTIFLGFGIAFEVPVVVVLLTLTGLITVEKLAASRGYVIIGIFVIAAVLTPPDPMSQISMAVPMCLLFEAGLIFARMLNRKTTEVADPGSSGKHGLSDARQRRMLVLCLATVYLVWGTSYIATRVGVLNLPPLLFAGVRFILGGALLTAVAFWRGFRPMHMKGQWRHLLVLSFIGVALSNGMQSWALQWMPSHSSALLNASCALWIVVFGLFGARAHHPGPRAVIGLVVGFAGTVLLMWPEGGSITGDALFIPQLVTLLACVVWSLGTIYMRNHSINLDLFALIGLQMLLGGIWMALAGVMRGELPLWHWSMAGALSLAYLVIFSCCFAYTAYGWLARHATPAQVGTYSYVNPLIAAIAGYVLLDEQISTLQIAGAVVILAGVLMINWPARLRAS